MDTNKELSREVSLALDILGYGHEMIKWRRYCYLRHSDSITKCVPPAPSSLRGLNFKPVLTGSKREGTSIWHQSDEDFMLIMDCFFCSPEPNLDSMHSSDKVWLKLATDKVYPGYVRLQRSWSDTDDSNSVLQTFMNSFMNTLPCGTQCLSSADFNKLIFNAYNEAYKRALQAKGKLSESLVDYIKKRTAQEPIEPGNYKLTIDSERLTLDVVAAFPCHYPELITEWKDRKRKHGWPSKEVINRILLLPGHVVSKGSKKSDSEHLEFRISYTLGEIELVKSFNEIQIKLYVLLKKLLKTELDSTVPDVFFLICHQKYCLLDL